MALMFSSALCALLLSLKRFDRLVKSEVEILLTRPEARRERVVTEEMLKGLPEPVRPYLTYTGIVGKPFVDIVFLKQRGAMHPTAKGAWVPLETEEHYTVRQGVQP